MSTTDELVDWLLAGDPAIRWQTLRDLQDAPPEVWRAEQGRTLQEGWGAQLLAQQAPDGTWGGGIYSPKWISTTYTLLTLCAIGIPGDYAPAQRAAALVLDEELGRTRDDKFMRKLAAYDRCIVGMDLQLAAYFGIADARVDAIVENLLAEVMPDGAWNCRRHRQPEPHHSSFHTTFNVLEGLRTWLETLESTEAVPPHPLRNDVLAAEQRALEFMLEHRLFKSDKTGAMVNDKFTLLSHPHHWHYDAFRGLAYFPRAKAPHDVRLEDGMTLLQAKRRADGTWPIEHRYSGKVYFHMEKMGGPSRWNTLRALRVLRWWESHRG